MKGPFAHPTIDSVKEIHREVLAAHGGSPGLRDESLLESAISAVQATVGGELLLETPNEIAAAYLFYLCKNHPFIDGNKRTALATCLVFLSENGLLPDENLDVDAWESLTLDIASNQIDRVQATKRLVLFLRSKKKKRNHRQ